VRTEILSLGADISWRMAEIASGMYLQRQCASSASCVMRAQARVGRATCTRVDIHHWQLCVRTHKACVAAVLERFDEDRHGIVGGAVGGLFGPRDQARKANRTHVQAVSLPVVRAQQLASDLGDAVHGAGSRDGVLRRVVSRRRRAEHSDRAGPEHAHLLQSRRRCVELLGRCVVALQLVVRVHIAVVFALQVLLLRAHCVQHVAQPIDVDVPCKIGVLLAASRQQRCQVVHDVDAMAHDNVQQCIRVADVADLELVAGFVGLLLRHGQVLVAENHNHRVGFVAMAVDQLR
jgi:hypothetical protein